MRASVRALCALALALSASSPAGAGEEKRMQEAVYLGDMGGSSTTVRVLVKGSDGRSRCLQIQPGGGSQAFFDSLSFGDRIAVTLRHERSSYDLGPGSASHSQNNWFFVSGKPLGAAVSRLQMQGEVRMIEEGRRIVVAVSAVDGTRVVDGYDLAGAPDWVFTFMNLEEVPDADYAQVRARVVEGKQAFVTMTLVPAKNMYGSLWKVAKLSLREP